jgi:8-oxo-dGTP pyrophosphatase MutT (NUDIX family)
VTSDTNEVISDAEHGTNLQNELQADEFFRRARARLNFDVPPALTDATIIPATSNPDMDKLLAVIAGELPLKSAAVLVAVVERAQPTVILTQRTQHLSSHAGQIAFPGGKIDPEDETPVDAALREAEEEIGLARNFVEPVGYLDVLLTPLGFRILPVLARVRPGFELNVNAYEVDDVFEVPLSFLMDPLNHKLKAREYRGIQRPFYEMPYGERYIWGATAMMLRALYERIVRS